MTQTPLQQAIAFWKQRYDEAKEERAFKMREAAGLFIDYLEAMLSSEKEFVGKVWDAADKRAEWERHKDRSLLDIILIDEPAPSKHIFLNQLYPEK